MKNSPYNTIDAKVAAFLNGVVKFESNFIREAMASKSEGWKETADYFVCSFTTAKGVYKSFDFFTGVGHRIASKKHSPYGFASYVVKAEEMARMGINAARAMYPVKDIKGLQGRTMDVNQWVINPTPANVLYSLLSDMSACETSFNDWCSDFGYDNDSLSALNTYQACCENGEKVRALFSNEQVEQLRELLEEY